MFYDWVLKRSLGSFCFSPLISFSVAHCLSLHILCLVYLGSLCCFVLKKDLLSLISLVLVWFFFGHFLVWHWIGCLSLHSTKFVYLVWCCCFSFNLSVIFCFVSFASSCVSSCPALARSLVHSSFSTFSMSWSHLYLTLAFLTWLRWWCLFQSVVDSGLCLGWHVLVWHMCLLMLLFVFTTPSPYYPFPLSSVQPWHTPWI